MMYILNIPFGFLLLFSYLANFINPSLISFFGLLGLAYPILLGANMLFVFFWLITLKKHIFFSLFCILIGFPQLGHLFQGNGQHKKMTSDNHIKVMTYNVRAFNYRLNEGWEENTRGIDATIESEAPDILCIQEYRKFKGMPRFSYRYKHVYLKNNTFGLAIYSNYKIVNKGTVDFETEGGNYQKFIYADVLLSKKDTVRIINAHLKSIGLDKSNLSHLKDSELTQHEIEIQKRKLIRPLLDAYKIRGKQTKVLSDFIQNSTLPIVFCGDLNDPPGSYAYHEVGKDLMDSFVHSGSGFSTTVPMFEKYYLPLRIDYIFYDKKFKAFNYEVVHKAYSDHFPIIVDLEY